LIGRKRLW